MADQTDHELMEATRRGDQTSLGVLFERHHERVHALCYRLTGDAFAADDLAQESFLRILKYSSGYRAQAAFTTWLYRLVRNVCMDYMSVKARDRKRTQLIAHEQQFLQPQDNGEESIPRHDTLRDALYALPPDKREVLVLSRYEGLSYAEIAEVCQTTVGAIKVRAHRAMRELRHTFEELERTL